MEWHQEAAVDIHLEDQKVVQAEALALAAVLGNPAAYQVHSLDHHSPPCSVEVEQAVQHRKEQLEEVIECMFFHHSLVWVDLREGEALRRSLLVVEEVGCKDRN